MLSKASGSKAESRAASGGLAISLVALLMGTLAGRRRLLANAVKFMAMVCLIVSLGVLVGACSLPSHPSSAAVESTITATSTVDSTQQSVSIYNTYTDGSE
jgi:hypothetical protein